MWLSQTHRVPLQLSASSFQPPPARVAFRLPPPAPDYPPVACPAVTAGERRGAPFPLSPHKPNPLPAAQSLATLSSRVVPPGRLPGRPHLTNPTARLPLPRPPQIFSIFPKCCYPQHPKSAQTSRKQVQIALYVLLPSCYPAATYLLPGCYPTATLATVVAALCQSSPMLLRAPHVIGSLWWRLSSSVVQPQANCAGLALRQPRSTSPAQ